MSWYVLGALIVMGLWAYLLLMYALGQFLRGSTGDLDDRP